jgi:hypothetical protein
MIDMVMDVMMLVLDDGLFDNRRRLANQSSNASSRGAVILVNIRRCESADLLFA